MRATVPFPGRRGNVCFTLGRSRVDETLDLYPGGHVERDALGPRDASCATQFPLLALLLWLLASLGFRVTRGGTIVRPMFLELFWRDIGLPSSSIAQRLFR